MRKSKTKQDNSVIVKSPGKKNITKMFGQKVIKAKIKVMGYTTKSQIIEVLDVPNIIKSDDRIK